MATEEYTKDQMDEVWSWIHDEQRCVTTQTVSLGLGLSRSSAALLLSNIPKHKPSDASYECTKCCLEKEEAKTVMKLQKSVVSASDMDVDDNSTIYSLALKESESVHSAHEKDMAKFRDLLQEEDSPSATETTLALDPRLHQACVTSSWDTSRTTIYASREERLGRRVAAAAAPSTVASSKATSKRTTTTAASFFAAKPKAKEKTETKAPARKKAAAPKKETKKAAAAPKKAAPKKESSKKSAKKRDEDVEMEEASDDDTVDFSQPEEEKENSVNATSKPSVGNADDFVGDEDEDEEFLEMERQRLSRNAAKEKKSKRKKQEPKPVEEKNEPVHGAMDAFAQAKKPASQETARHHKRRKKLVEKTSMDANGYIHTETQAVWEDVPTDDEEEEVPAAAAAVKKPPPKKVKNTKNMKQGSLMGFFKKK